jgi:glycosyltransferase involved in cell wall biosynthesis
MRIVLVNDHARVTGGADVHCFALDRLLRERGHEVRFLSTWHPENIVDRGAFIPKIVDRASRDSLSGRDAARVFAVSCWNRDAAAAAERLLTDFKPDLVHAHKLYPQLSVAPVIAAARRSVPVVQTAHDYEFVSASALDDRGRWYDRDETRASYRLLNGVLFRIKRALHVPRVSSWVAVSRDLADVYRDHGAIEARPLPNFVIAGEHVLPRTVRSGALYVGRLTREKGVEQVIEVARRLPELPVTVAGFGPLAELVASSAEEIPNLTFEGPLERTEVEQRLRSARLLLMPGTWREPAGLVALEAMSAGTPVIAYGRGGLAEYIRSAGGGSISPPGLPAFVAAIRRLLGDDCLWQELSDRGAEAARTAHAPDVYLDELESVYRAAVSSVGARPL